MGLQGAGLTYAEEVGQLVSDAVLRLNPFIQPEERREKRQYAALNLPNALWQTVVCQPAYEKKTRTGEVVQLIELETTESIPVLDGVSVRREYQATSSLGFYLRFQAMHRFLSLPNKRPGNWVSTTAKYMDCGGNEGLAYGLVLKNSMSIDYRKFALIQSDQTTYPSHSVDIPRDPSSGGLILEKTFLKPLRDSDIWPREDSKYRYALIEKTLYYDLPLRPIRFRLKLPPMTVQGVEVPLPTCFFEPFDISTDKFAGASR